MLAFEVAAELEIAVSVALGLEDDSTEVGVVTELRLVCVGDKLAEEEARETEEEKEDEGIEGGVAGLAVDGLACVVVCDTSGEPEELS